jgi:hypothetical protein
MLAIFLVGNEGKGSSLVNQMGFLPYPSIENYNPFLEDVPSSSYVAQSSSSSPSASSLSSTASFMKQSMEKSKYAERSNSQHGSSLYPHKCSSNADVNSPDYDATVDLIQLEDSVLPYQPLNNYAALNSDSMTNSTTEIDQNVMDYTMTDTGYKSCSLYENKESTSVKKEKVPVKVSEEKIPLLLKETLEGSAISETPIFSDEEMLSGGLGQESKSKSQFEVIDELIDHVTKSKVTLLPDFTAVQPVMFTCILFNLNYGIFDTTSVCSSLFFQK